MSDSPNQRDLESSIRTDLAGRLDYSAYLSLDRILNGPESVVPIPRFTTRLLIHHPAPDLGYSVFTLVIPESAGPRCVIALAARRSSVGPLPDNSGQGFKLDCNAFKLFNQVRAVLDND